MDNEDNRLPLEYSEVTVTRRIYRSGESGFFINKTPCRLKDIQELFMDTGIGRDELFNNKPRKNRRNIKQ